MSGGAASSFNIVGVDNVTVPFPRDYISKFGFIDVIQDANNTFTEFTITVADSKTLTLLRELLDLQATTGTPFKQPSVERIYHGIKTVDPCYANGEDPWRATAAAGTYAATFAAIPVPDLCRLFAACDYLDCSDLLHGIAYILIPHIFDYTATVVVEPHYRQLLAKIHTAAMTV